MKIQQLSRTATSAWNHVSGEDLGVQAQLVFAFGGRDILTGLDMYNDLRKQFPVADILMCSTSGEISDTEVNDNSVAVTAIEFAHTTIRIARVNMADHPDSKSAGSAVSSALQGDALQHIFVISDGLHVNGTTLVEGIQSMLPKDVSVTGGLAGDGALFTTTIVGYNGEATSKEIVAIGLYGDRLKVGYASFGGWTPFGTERLVTKSEANILYELDGKPALELYKTFLGDKAAELPASALLFPLSINNPDAPEGRLVRTILTIDEDKNSMTFAGDIPQGSTVRLMKSNFNDLVNGAEKAAEISHDILGTKPELAILVSCVGRKLMMGQHIEDETEIIREVLGDAVPMTGFYSYGELAPATKNQSCLLHNQTMTITLFAEV